MQKPKTLAHAEAKRFYDRFGRKQDLQSFYENPAIDALIEHGDFGRASSVFEFGFGTGSFARRLLSDHLHSNCRYEGVDISDTMVVVARGKLINWSNRVSLRKSDGSVKLDQSDQSFDRFISTYVLDLLSETDIRVLLSEAWRLLRPEGLLCLASMTKGKGFAGRMVTALWLLVYSLNPRILGGCRPIQLVDYLDPVLWDPVHHEVVSSFGLSSEVVIARKKLNP